MVQAFSITRSMSTLRTAIRLSCALYAKYVLTVLTSSIPKENIKITRSRSEMLSCRSTLARISGAA